MKRTFALLVFPLKGDSNKAFTSFHLIGKLPSPSSSNATAPVVYANKLIAWGEKKWTALGNSAPNSLSRKTYDLGTRLLDKVEPQETFLKSLPQEPVSTNLILIVPSSNKDSIVQEIKTMIEHRIPYHKKYLYLSAMFLPISFACSILPGPNLPLAYNLFRVYSHHRAYNGALTLKNAIDSEKLQVQTSEVFLRWWEVNKDIDVPSKSVTDTDIKVQHDLDFDFDLDNLKRELSRSFAYYNK